MKINRSIVIVGSSNTDIVIKSNHLPAAGETILGGKYFMNLGGKGAKQAVAANRLGGDVTFICKIGKDIFGTRALELLNEEGLKSEFIIIDSNNPSGVALIVFDEYAEKTIVVASGANSELNPSDITEKSSVICNSAIVLMQLEIPLKTIYFVADIAKATSSKVILNPTPACNLPESLFRNLWIITPNEKEAEVLSGIAISDIPSIEKAANIIRSKGVEIVIITLGSKGAFISTAQIEELVPSPIVSASNNTASGDVFNGALAVALSENLSLRDAVNFACHSAALSVMKLGEQSSAPYRQEVTEFMESSTLKENKS